MIKLPTAVFTLLFLLLAVVGSGDTYEKIISPLTTLKPLTQDKGEREVFGFAPFWNLDKLDNVDFNVLTTLAFFGIPSNENGDLDQYDPGFSAFESDQATKLFKKAHSYNTKVVLTLVQMDNNVILILMDNNEAQKNLISQAVELVQKRGIDGINVDFEYTGDPGQDYRDIFTKFVASLTKEMHLKNPRSKVTVSVYASSVKDPKIYDIEKLSQITDGIFMMAYDFAVASSDNAIPTAPLYGHKEGKYWYDIATAVNDFLKKMPAQKLILGVPLYGYNYVVYEPEIKAETRPYYSWRGQAVAQTYAAVQDSIKPDMPGILDYKTGWDNAGQVGWKAYYVAETDTWRMIFLDDVKSLAAKFDFAKSKNLAGVGLWALGFDEGKKELWALLEKKFGIKLAVLL